MQAREEELVDDAARVGLIVQAVERFGQVRIRALGTSMFPAIRSGDVLHVARAAAETLSPGEIVVVRSASRIFAHRLLRRSPSGAVIVTRGDAHLHEDPPASYRDVIGRVVAIEREGRSLHVPVRLSTPRRWRGIAASVSSALWRRTVGRLPRLHPAEPGRCARDEAPQV
jgi:hypothetical protein